MSKVPNVANNLKHSSSESCNKRKENQMTATFGPNSQKSIKAKCNSFSSGSKICKEHNDCRK
jgi:heat shock protein HslJ